MVLRCSNYHPDENTLQYGQEHFNVVGLEKSGQDKQASGADRSAVLLLSSDKFVHIHVIESPKR